MLDVHGDALADMFAAVDKIPKAIQMIGRNCGVYTEDDLLIDLDMDEVGVVGDSSCALDGPANSYKPPSRATSLQPSLSRFVHLSPSN